MHLLDFIVLVGYFLVLIAIGIWTSRHIRKQEDFFMGNRSFGKLLQTFAAFGAGTGPSDPVTTGRTTFTSGLSGMWSVMYWLFVTPFYWITGVWYRRMRHLTLGDWFVERYQSKAMGAGYCIFGLLFFMVYGSMFFSAIAKVAAPLVETDVVVLFGQQIQIEYVLVPIIAVVVIGYGIAGGLEAAYYTDLIQGICIILLSIILIPIGLNALVEKFGDPSTQGIMSGFKIMHERLPPEHFTVVGSTSTSEFPWYRILAVVIINLVGIVVQPHFIATGGGSAKTETSARIGLVTGNFLKRFCTVGWVLTALIALTLFGDQTELIDDPGRTWGVASRELLGPGLRGLMLACLLAALMSSVDAYMVVGSGLVVRNIYAPYVDPNASEKHYVMVGRITGAIVVLGAVIVSLTIMDLFLQQQLTWVFGVLFAAPFWIGMYWRRATTAAAWITVAYCAFIFFLIPFFAPIVYPDLRTNETYLTQNQLIKTTTIRPAAQSDVEKRAKQIALWDEARQKISQLPESEQKTALQALGNRPEVLKKGDSLADHQLSGGQSIFWGDGVKPVDENGNVLTDVKPVPVGTPEKIDEKTTQVRLEYPENVRLMGMGSFKLDFLLYQWAGVDLESKSNGLLATLELPPKIVAPFLVMIFFSLITPRNKKDGLDKYYVKMNTPVDPDHEKDQQNLEEAYANPDAYKHNKIWPNSSWEINKPSATDVIGFVICFALCFGIIGFAVWVANLGS